MLLLFSDSITDLPPEENHAEKLKSESSFMNIDVCDIYNYK